MEVRLKHIRPERWSGVYRFPNCNDALGPYLTRSGSLYTGLTKEDEERLGNTLGYDLRKSSDFWVTFRIRVGSEDLIFDGDDPEDELKLLFLKGHKRVKASITDVKAGTDYYLSNPEEEADTFNEANRLKRKANIEFAKLKAADIKKALRIYGLKSDNVSDAVAEDRLYSLLETNPQHFLDKWVNNKHRATEYLIKEAMAQDVVRKSGNSYLYNTITLGYSLGDAIAFIDSGENSDIKAEIINVTTKK